MARSRSGSGSMSVREAGEEGGRSTYEKYGPAHYSRIGQKGGRSRSAQRSSSSGDIE